MKWTDVYLVLAAVWMAFIAYMRNLAPRSGQRNYLTNTLSHDRL